MKAGGHHPKAHRGPATGLLLALAAMTAGCSTPPLPAATGPGAYDVAHARVYGVDKDVIWERAVAYFAAHNLSIKTIDKASGLIAVDREVDLLGPGFGGMADCGKAPLLRKTAQTIDLNLFVRQLDDQKSSVTVNTHFTETRMLGYNALTATTISCVSTGKLEDAVLDALQTAL